MPISQAKCPSNDGAATPKHLKNNGKQARAVLRHLPWGKGICCTDAPHSEFLYYARNRKKAIANKGKSPASSAQGLLHGHKLRLLLHDINHAESGGGRAAFFIYQ